MEKRRYPREVTSHPVTLTAREGVRIAGTIRNFSPGGLLIEVSQDLDEAPKRVEVVIADDIPIVGAHVVRATHQWIAVAFDRVQHGIAAHLRPKTGEGFPAAAQNRSVRPANDALQARLVDACAAYVVGLTGAFLEHAKERLIDAADAAGSYGRQAPYFEAFTILRRKQRTIEEGLAKSLESRGIALDTARDGPAAPAEPTPSELSLIDETEFDIWLIESDTASNAEAALTAELEALNSRLASALGAAVDERNNPFAPRALAMHCSDVLLDLELDTLARTFCLRSFGEVVLRDARPMIDVLNGILDAAGFTYKTEEPHFRGRGSTARAMSAPEAHGSAAEAAAGANGEAPQEMAPGMPAPAGSDQSATQRQEWSWATPESPAGTLLDLHRLVSDPRRATASIATMASAAAANAAGRVTGAAAVKTPMVSTEMLQELLADIQERAHRNRHIKLQKRLENTLEELSGDWDPKPKLSPAQQDAIYLADELLSSMTADMIASDQGKSWIKHLEIPLLRLLLEDEDILTDNDHPARTLLDNLGQAHWRGDSNAPRDQAMVTEIDRVIEKLVAGDRIDRDRVRQAAIAVSQLVKRSRQRADSNMRRVLEACRGQERLSEARSAVERKLTSVFKGREVSKILADLLDSGYRDLLVVDVLRADDDRDDGKDGFAVIEKLHARLSRAAASASEVVDDASSDEPEDNPGAEPDEELLELVRERLEMTSADPGAQQGLIDRLHAQLKGEVPPEAAAIIFNDYPVEEPSEDTTSIEQRLWLGQAKMLDVGDWMIFPEDTGPGRPLKLAWVSRGRDRYVYVDRDGHKALELNQDELAGKIGAGTAQLGESGDRPLTDRSWQTMVERLQEQVAHQATHDHTSGVLNRKEFERRVRIRISESKLNDTQHGVIMADLDQFRLLNSASGHDAGDQMLHAAGRLVRATVGEDAEVARTGSDEFSVLLPRVEGDAIDAAAESIRRALGSLELDWKGKRLTTTASVGWVSVDRESIDFSTVFSQLELACATARETGDKVCGFTPSDVSLARHDRALLRLRQLEEALEGNGLLLMGQRIQRLDGKDRGEHYEVLSRLRTPDGEIISPAEFVGAAESYGRVHLLDRAVLETTVEALATSPLREQMDCLSVNVSGLSFTRAGFVEHVRETLDRWKLSPNMLCLEITESAAMSDLSRCADVVRELREIGCRFSLDDFGTGLSSFSYLKHLPVDYLKIDGSFVRGIHEDTDDRGLVRSMHEMAHLLGKETIAEYAESATVIEVLKSIGIDHAQGYGVEEPRPLRDILALATPRPTNTAPLSLECPQ